MSTTGSGSAGSGRSAECASRRPGRPMAPFASRARETHGLPTSRRWRSATPVLPWGRDDAARRSCADERMRSFSTSPERPGMVRSGLKRCARPMGRGGVHPGRAHRPAIPGRAGARARAARPAGQGRQSGALLPQPDRARLTSRPAHGGADPILLDGRGGVRCPRAPHVRGRTDRVTASPGEPKKRQPASAQPLRAAPKGLRSRSGIPRAFAAGPEPGSRRFRSL